MNNVKSNWEDERKSQRVTQQSVQSLIEGIYIFNNVVISGLHLTSASQNYGGKMVHI